MQNMFLTIGVFMKKAKVKGKVHYVGTLMTELSLTLPSQRATLHSPPWLVRWSQALMGCQRYDRWSDCWRPAAEVWRAQEANAACSLQLSATGSRSHIFGVGLVKRRKVVTHGSTIATTFIERISRVTTSHILTSERARRHYGLK